MLQLTFLICSLLGLHLVQCSRKDIDLISSVVESLPNDSWDDDLVVNQSEETLIAPLTLNYTVKETGETLFLRFSEEAYNKDGDRNDIIVFKSSEGTEGGRIYVVLKHDQDLGKHYYRVFYAYLRNRNDGGNGSLIEFDFWSSREKSDPFGWAVCFRSVLAACKLELPAEAILGADVDERQSSSSNNNDEIQTPEGSSYEENEDTPLYPFFIDLEQSLQDLLYIKKMIGIYVYTLSAATGAASKLALDLSGMKTTTIPSSELETFAKDKLTDIKLAVSLFQETIGDGDPKFLEQFVPTDKVIVTNSADFVQSEDATEDEQETLKKGSVVRIHAEGGLIKGTMLGLIFGPNGLINKEEFLGYWSSLKGHSKNRTKNDTLADFAGKVTPPGADDKVAKILKSLVDAEGGSGRDVMRSVAGALLGADGAGDIIESMAGSLLAGAGGGVERFKTLMLRMFGGGGVDLFINKAEEYVAQGGYMVLVNNAVKFISSTDVDILAIGEIAFPIVVAVMKFRNNVPQPPLNSNMVQPVTGFLTRHRKYIVETGIQKVPILGQPVALITGFFERVLKLVANATHAQNKTEPRVETSLFAYIGWLTRDINPEQLGAQFTEILKGSSSNPPFIGFGNCVTKLVLREDLLGLNASDWSEAAEVYSALFKNQCSDRHKIQVEKLLETKIVRLVKGGTLRMNWNHPIMKKQKLSKSELTSLSAALELTSLSRAILRRWAPKPKLRAATPNGLSLTPTIATLSSTLLQNLALTLKKLPLHFIKLSRAALLTLRTAITKLLQDYYRLKACGACGGLLNKFKPNILQLVALQQFIINGDYTHAQMAASFKSYFDNHTSFLEYMADIYY